MIQLILVLLFALNMNAMDDSANNELNSAQEQRVNFRTFINAARYKSFSRDVIVGCDEGIFIFDHEAKKIKRKMVKGFSYVDSLMLSAKGHHIIASSFLEDEAAILDADTLAIIRKLKKLKELTEVNSIVTVAYGLHEEVAVGYDNGLIGIWQHDMVEPLDCLQKHDEQAVPVMAYNQERLIAGYSNGELVVFNHKSKELTQLQDQAKPINCVACNHNGHSFVSGSDEGTISLWDLNCGTKTDQFATTSSPVNAISCTIAGLIAAGHKDGMSSISDPRTSKVIRQAKIHDKGVHTIDWRYDGKEVVSAACEKRLGFWNFADE
jgi:WD domain, G-beta repeat